MCNPHQRHEYPLYRRERRSGACPVDDFRLNHHIISTFPPYDTLACCLHVAEPVCLLTKSHRHNKAIRRSSCSDRCGVRATGTPPGMMKHSKHRQIPAPRVCQNERVQATREPPHKRTTANPMFFAGYSIASYHVHTLPLYKVFHLPLNQATVTKDPVPR